MSTGSARTIVTADVMRALASRRGGGADRPQAYSFDFARGRERRHSAIRISRWAFAQLAGTRLDVSTSLLRIACAAWLPTVVGFASAVVQVPPSRDLQSSRKCLIFCMIRRRSALASRWSPMVVSLMCINAGGEPAISFCCVEAPGLLTH